MQFRNVAVAVAVALDSKFCIKIFVIFRESSLAGLSRTAIAKKRASRADLSLALIK